MEAELSTTAVRAAFRKAFKSVWSSHPLYGARTQVEAEPGVGTRTGPDAWWALVVARTFGSVVTATGKEGAKALDDLQTAILHRFASDKGYTLFPDVLPTLATMRSQFPRVALGIASNSDTRILNAMRDLGVGAWLNIDPFIPDVTHPARPGWPPAVLSYAIRAEKPSNEFFTACVQAASRSTGVSVRPEETLYIGDHLLEDFRAARAARLNALWLRRPEEWVYKGPHNEAIENDLASQGLNEDERAHVVRSLEEVPAWLQARTGH